MTTARIDESHAIPAALALRRGYLRGEHTLRHERFIGQGSLVLLGQPGLPKNETYLLIDGNRWIRAGFHQKLTSLGCDLVRQLRCNWSPYGKGWVCRRWLISSTCGESLSDPRFIRSVLIGSTRELFDAACCSKHQAMTFCSSVRGACSCWTCSRSRC